MTVDSDKHITGFFGIPGSNIWLSQFHASESGFLNGAKALRNGDVIIAGVFTQTMAFGGQVFSPPNGSHFIARLDATNAAVLWIRVFDNTEQRHFSFKGIDIDSADNIFAVGGLAATTTIDGILLRNAGAADALVMKLSSRDGSVTWAHSFGDTLGDVVDGVAVDAADDVVIAGLFSGSISPGPQPLVGVSAMFVVKYNGATGAHLWSRAAVAPVDAPDGHHINPAAIALDRDGNPVIAGAFAGIANFGNGNTVPATDDALYENGFVVKYASDTGAYMLSQSFGSRAAAKAVAVDNDNNIYAWGHFFGQSVDVNGHNIPSAGAQDVLLVKYAVSGAYQWAKRFGNSFDDVASSMTIDAAGHLVVVGTFKDTVSYGGPTLPGIGDTDIVVASLDAADGSHLASIRLGGTAADFPSVVCNAGRNLFVAGQFLGTAEFGGQLITAPGAFGDGFALMIHPLR